MGFLSSLKGLIKHEAVVTTSPTKSEKSEPVQVDSQSSHKNQPQQHLQQINSPQTRVTTQRPAPSTPSPRAHA